MRPPNFKPYYDFVSMMHRLEVICKQSCGKRLREFCMDIHPPTTVKLNKECRARGYDDIWEAIKLADGYWEPPAADGRKALGASHTAPGRGRWDHLKEKGLALYSEGKTPPEVRRLTGASWGAVYSWRKQWTG